MQTETTISTEAVFGNAEIKNRSFGHFRCGKSFCLDSAGDTQPHSIGKTDGRGWAGSAAGAEGGAIRVASAEHGG